MKRKRYINSPLSLLAFQDIITSVTGVFLMLTLLMAIELTTRNQLTSSAPSVRLVEQLQSAIRDTRSRLEALQARLASRREQGIEHAEYTQRSAELALAGVREEVRHLQSSLAQLRRQQQALQQTHDKAEAALENRAVDRDRLEQLHEERVALSNEVTDLKASHRVFYNDTDESGRRVWLAEMFADEILLSRAGDEEAPRRFSGNRRVEDVLNWARTQSASRVRFVLIVHKGTTKQFKELRQKLRKQGFAIGFDLLPHDKIAVDPIHGAK